MTGVFDFARPWMLVLLPLAVLPLLPRRSDTLPFPSVAWLPVDRTGRWLEWLARTGAVLTMLGIVAGLAGPGRSHLQTVHIGSGAEILILMDRSASMDEMMESKGIESTGDSKSKVARASLTGFVAKRPNDRVGLMMFGISPVLAMPFTYDHRAIDGAIDGTAIGRGMPDTQLDRGLLRAIGEFDSATWAGRRAIVLVSDGGARLDEHARALIEAGLARSRIALYFIYLRSSVYSPDLNATVTTNAGSPEADLHRYFLTLKTPYRLFQAGDARAMTAAMTEIDRQQNALTSFVEQLPRQDASPYCFAVALLCCALLLVLQQVRVRAWP